MLLARVTGPFARCPSSQGTIQGAIDNPVHAARGDVRLVGRGGRGEVRGRDARATGWRVEAHDISAFTCAYLGTP